MASLCFQCLLYGRFTNYLSGLSLILLRSYSPACIMVAAISKMFFSNSSIISTLGRNSFAVFGLKVWNFLPFHLRHTQTHGTLKNIFKHIFSPYTYFILHRVLYQVTCLNETPLHMYVFSWRTVSS